jgi:hypothetical protein
VYGPTKSIIKLHACMRPNARLPAASYSLPPRPYVRLR